MGFVPQKYGYLLTTFIVVNVLLMLISTVLGGYMVIEGREFKATGRLGSFRNSAMTAATLVAGPAAGYLAGIHFGWTAGINTGLLLLLFAYVFAAVREKPIPREIDAPSPFRKLADELQPLLRAKTFWAAVGMTFLLMVMPGFGTPFLYYQTDVLKLSPQFIGNLGLISSAMGLIGGAAYIVFCRRIPLRTMLALSIVVAAFSTSLYQLYRTPTAAILIEAANGLLSALPEIALFDLAARAAPERSAALSYSLLMAVYNFGARLSDSGGSYLHDNQHISIFTLIWISAGTTLLTLVAVPFLPRALVDSADGEPAPAAPAIDD
jgi:Na+/melibiose symporter-like transporter